MSTVANTNEPSVSWDDTGKRSAGMPGGPDRARLITYLSIAAAALPAALLLFIGVVAGLPLKQGEIEAGVRIGGFAVGAEGWDATEPALASHLDRYLTQPLTVEVGESTRQVTPSQLGISFDLDATRERAAEVGHGSFMEAVGERFIARTNGLDVQPVVIFDDKQFMETMNGLTASVVEPPRNAAFSWNGQAVVVVPAEDGIAVNGHRAALALKNTIGQMESGPVALPLVTIDPKISTGELEAVLDDANKFAGQPLRLLDEDQGWQLTPEELLGLLRYDGASVKLDMQAVERRIGTLASVIDSEAQDAAVRHTGNGRFYVLQSSDQRKLDLPATMAAVGAALENGNRDVKLVVDVTRPSLAGTDVQPVFQQITEIMQRGMLIVWPDGEEWLDPVAYADVFEIDPAQGNIQVNRDKMHALISPIAERASRTGTGLRWRGDHFTVLDNADPGRSIDLEASVSAAIDGALHGNPVVNLAVAENPDPMLLAGNIHLPDMLAQSVTYYGNSSTNRKINVEVGAASIDGALIPPGGTFSFNQAAGGSTSLEDGYQMGYGIVIGADGVPRTVPSVAGGICLVATTVFQAAFWTGVDITNRSWHLYWIPSYGEGVGGLKGLDATVDADYGLDFNFVNTTDNWLAIRSWADGEYHTVQVWGTSQGWSIDVGEPEIANIVEADKEKVYREENSEMKPGQEAWVESAGDGFSASIHRTVTDRDGNVIGDRVFYSYYQPSRNVILVAPGEGDASKLSTPVETEEVSNDEWTEESE